MKYNIFLLTVFFFSCSSSDNTILVTNSGEAQGSYYHIKYMSANGDNYKFQIDYLPDNQIRFNVTGHAAQNQILADLTNDQWNHIVITKSDNSTDDKTVRMYTGGSLRDNASGVTTRWDKIKIGLNRGDHNHWDGYIDEVIIYNRTLSTQEVLDLYECY